MNCFLITLSIFVLISKSRSENIELSTSEDKSFAAQFATILGIFWFHFVLKFVSPIILKAGFVPLIFIAKVISKPLIMIGLTGWLMVLFTPLILARSGITSPVFESRSQENTLFSSIGRLMSTNMSTITTETMNFFNLDNEECKLEMSCRVGKRMANSIPYLQYFVTQSGAANWIESKYIANMIRSMTDSNQCKSICKSLSGEKTHSSTTYSTDSSDSGNDNVFEWLG